MIFIVSGFSGAGKSELIKAIPAELNTELILSYTTRAKRNENDNYHFVDKDTFKKMVDRGAFVETMEYNDNFYGTPKEDLFIALQNGKTPVLDIDYRGAKAIINSNLFHRENIVSIFVAADADELYSRLTYRGTETPATIQKRLIAALTESDVVNSDLYDIVLLNHELDKTKKQFVSIIQGNHCESQHFDEIVFQRSIRDVFRRDAEADETIIQYRIFVKDIEIGLLQINAKGQHRYFPIKENVDKVYNWITFGEMLHPRNWGDCVCRCVSAF